MGLPDDVEPLLASVRPEVVFHLAAPVNPGRVPDEQAARTAIVDGTQAVIAACGRMGARLVHVGTCAEYGDVAVPYKESESCCPLGAYGRMKHEASQSAVASSSLDWSVVRPFRAIGPGDTRSVVALAARAAALGQPFEMTDGQQIREWNHVRSIAAGIVAAGAHPEAIHQIINVGGGPQRSVLSMVERVFALAGAEPSLVRAGARVRRPHEVDALFGDHSKAEGLWGRIQQPSLDHTLQLMVRENGGRAEVSA